MSTLEKTINLLNVLSESQIEMIYSFAQFLSSQQTAKANIQCYSPMLSALNL